MVARSTRTGSTGWPHRQDGIVIAVGLALAALAIPLTAAAVGVFAWLPADTPDLQARSSSSMGVLLSDAARVDDGAVSRPIHGCA